MKDPFDEWFDETHSSSPEWDIESDADDLDIPYTDDDEDCTHGYGVLV